jgi:hypothetical protein
MRETPEGVGLFQLVLRRGSGLKAGSVPGLSVLEGILTGTKPATSPGPAEARFTYRAYRLHLPAKKSALVGKENGKTAFPH